MSGRLAIVGLGPGDPAMQTPQAAAALAGRDRPGRLRPYLDRVPQRPGQARHASDNREELDRARHALALAAAGRRVAVVSSGDAGVFAMASAVFEAIEDGRAELARARHRGGARHLRHVRRRRPAGRAARARFLRHLAVGQPQALAGGAAAAARGGRGRVRDRALQPASRARPWQLGAAFDALRAVLPAATPVVFATAVSRAGRADRDHHAGRADPAAADMRTLVLIGSAATRLDRARRAAPPWLYTPRARAPCDASQPARPPRRAPTDGPAARRARHHDHRQAERARGGELGRVAVAAGVLGHQHLDPLRRAAAGARRPRERAARGDAPRRPAAGLGRGGSTLRIR